MSAFLTLPSPPPKKRVMHSRDDVDDYLSSDLDASFASSVSLNEPMSLTPDQEYPQPMDISPAAPKPVAATRARPRAFTASARIFNDLSNTPPPQPTTADSKAHASQSGSKRIQRSALPLEWMMTSQPVESPKPTDCSPLSDDAMDVDSSFDLQPAATSYQFPVVPHTAAPTVTTFNNLFYDSTSPMVQRRSFESPAGPQQKKRRSHSPETTQHQPSSSSPALASSPSQQKLERIASGSLFGSFAKPSLEGLGAPPQSNVAKKPRRPVLSAMVRPTDIASAQSAYPILTTIGESDGKTGLPPTRRAFSALITPSAMSDQLDDESSFDGPDYSSPAQAYAKRQQLKTIRRCDGTEDFRPLTGATAMVIKETSPTKFGSHGLPGFGDNEAHGKILPCHRVSEDGLMRITPQTLDDLLDGAYENQIRDFHIIDCRFDYEYEGGHVQGAVNINTAQQVEALLLGPSLTKPKPSVSGDSTKKTVLIFHCEFSVKRAPTFAKHLRAKDRAMNNHVYPKIHYPEVYILEGGYSNYFKLSSSRCDPPAYVPMDDPSHLASRREDLDQFRKTKFGRHKSYTYGDGISKSAAHSQQQKRNTAPTGGATSLFAAATAARSRRVGAAGSLSTLTEDASAIGDHEDTDVDIGDSPCPPPTKSATTRGKKTTSRVLTRSETYGPARMPLGQ